MRTTSVAVAVSLPLLALAQSSTTSSAAAGATHDVAVGQGGLVFTPDTIQAAVGDVVRFNFYPQNHSVAQATFDAPCLPKDQGIFSGYLPVSSGEGSTSFLVPINNTDAVWLYCSQGQHCQAGMVAVINPVGGTSQTSLANFRTAAAKATENHGPTNNTIIGGQFAANSNSSSSGTSTTTSTSTSSGASGSSTSGSGSSQSSGSSGSSSGASSASSAATATPTGNAAAGLHGEHGIAGSVGAVIGGLAFGAWAMI